MDVWRGSRVGDGWVERGKGAPGRWERKRVGSLACAGVRACVHVRVRVRVRARERVSSCKRACLHECACVSERVCVRWRAQVRLGAGVLACVLACGRRSRARAPDSDAGRAIACMPLQPTRCCANLDTFGAGFTHPREATADTEVVFRILIYTFCAKSSNVPHPPPLRVARVRA